MSSVGDRIRERRVELGLSQRDLEVRPGVSYAYISRVEHGNRTPSTKALRLIAPRLGVSAHWLETGEEDPVELAMGALRVALDELAQVRALLDRERARDGRELVA